MKKTLLATVLALLCAQAAAAEYFVVVPLPGKTANASPSAPASPDPAPGDPAPQPALTVGLNSYTLPDGVVGAEYAGFDFKSVLQVTGDTNYDPAQATFTAANLPAGLALSSVGVLAGVPTVKDTAGTNFDVTATYKGQSAQRTYSVAIYAQGVSCADILGSQPTAGDGLYTLVPDGTTQIQTYCDMSNGGWTLVAFRKLNSAPGVATTEFTSALPTSPSYLPDTAWVALMNSSTDLRAVKGGSPLTAANIISIAKAKSANCAGLATTLSRTKLFHFETAGCTVTGTDYTMLGNPVTATRSTTIYNAGTLKWDVYVGPNSDLTSLTVWVK